MALQLRGIRARCGGIPWGGRGNASHLHPSPSPVFFSLGSVCENQGLYFLEYCLCDEALEWQSHWRPIDLRVRCSFESEVRLHDDFKDLDQMFPFHRLVHLVVPALKQFVDHLNCQAFGIEVKREVTSNDTITSSAVICTPWSCCRNKVVEQTVMVASEVSDRKFRKAISPNEKFGAPGDTSLVFFW
ncbi:unnamed protein product [Schistocephalus solidus]|uniref:Uncharacterized protein n=1 Tax=Schistocephalus solidus TaxID=70667 RepID=A0A183SL49_SCHSO|nr:unnamed protein product [Schistocephalus solidus]